MFICVKNYITFAELQVDEVYELIAAEVNGRDPKNTWEAVGIYRSPNNDVRLLEKLADWTGYMGRTMKRSIIGGDLNLPYVDLASLRHQYLGSFFLDPEDIRVLGVGAIWNLIKGTGLL